MSIQWLLGCADCRANTRRAERRDDKWTLTLRQFTTAAGSSGMAAV